MYVYMVDIVRQIQKLNQILYNSMENAVTLSQFCQQLSKVLQTNIYFFYPNGNIFCYATSEEYPCAYTELSMQSSVLPERYKSFFDGVERSVFNVYEGKPQCTYKDIGSCVYGERYYSIVPIHYYASTAEKAGMLMVRYGAPFENDEIVLCEYASIVASMVLFYSAQSTINENALQKAASLLAVSSLSEGETKAACIILDQIDRDTDEGTVVLAKITAKAFVAQSVASSALKKLESAGVIITKSYGVKGKYIKIRNTYLRSQLKDKSR